MSRNHWSEIHRVWSHYTPPLRPNSEVLAEMQRQIQGISGRVLLLGATPELAGLAGDVVAIDKNQGMIADLWRGNSAGRLAIVGNWMYPNFAPASFALGVGDGSLNAVTFPDETALLRDELARALRCRGRLVFRAFTLPDVADAPLAIKAAALRGSYSNFHGCKWRLAMAIAAGAAHQNLEMRKVFDLFTELFPDRDRLVAITGWNRDEIDTIDLLKGSIAISAFPTRQQLHSVLSRSFSDVRFIAAGTYEFAEHCPQVVAERP